MYQYAEKRQKHCNENIFFFVVAVLGIGRTSDGFHDKVGLKRSDNVTVRKRSKVVPAGSVVNIELKIALDLMTMAEVMSVSVSSTLIGTYVLRTCCSRALAVSGDMRQWPQAQTATVDAEAGFKEDLQASRSLIARARSSSSRTPSSWVAL
jgi:hypothetical protein